MQWDLLRVPVAARTTTTRGEKKANRKERDVVKRTARLVYKYEQTFPALLFLSSLPRVLQGENIGHINDLYLTAALNFILCVHSSLGASHESEKAASG